MSGHEQAEYAIRFEWGPTGAALLVPEADVVVLVDVLSFCTSVNVAVERGATVVPIALEDERTLVAAADRQTVRAVGRAETTSSSPYSLSPRSLRGIRAGTRLLLPSPNGAAIAASCSSLEARLIAGCHRNAGAVGAAARELGGAVIVVAAGERWPDGSLRVALEDLAGAGAILAGLAENDRSPEANIAVGAFHSISGSPAALTRALLNCGSGRELTRAGYEEDVATAAELDASDTVPILVDGEFRELAMA